MSSAGLQLVSIGLCRYTFEEGPPGEYACRIELLEKHPSSTEGRQYIRFIEGAGAEYLGNIFRWAYFRRKTENGGFDLFSDIDSRLRHLKRISALLLSVFIMELCIGVYNLTLYFSLEYYRRGFYGNLFSGMLCLSLALLIFYGLLKVRKKSVILRKERILHE